jgi:uncharacterized OB-fold protein
MKREPTKRITILTRPPGWNRKCQCCGKDPWPNQMHCYDCKSMSMKNNNDGGYGSFNYAGISEGFKRR